MSIRSRSAAILFATAGVVWPLDSLNQGVGRAFAGGPSPGNRDPRCARPPIHDELRRRFQPGPDAPWIFAGASLLVAGVIVVTAFHHERVITSVALGLILGALSGTSRIEPPEDPG